MTQPEICPSPTPARVIPRSAHSISRRDIAPEALKVLYRLHRSGYTAYLVGGGVRDLLLKRRPKDFDVATDARPNKLRKLFRNCRVIGNRFRLVHVLFPGNKRVEVSTFRRSPDPAAPEGAGPFRDNAFGSPEEDAKRRDLTINGLFYDIASFSVLDYVGGVADLEHGIIRTIIEPNQSFREDPVRMLRALRHGGRLGFTIEETTYQAILANRELLASANSSRLTEEFYRDLRGGSSEKLFRLMMATELLNYMFPEVARQVAEDPHHPLWNRLAALDAFALEGREYSNALLAAVLLQTVLMPPDVLASRRGDLGRIVYQNLRAMKSHFRVSLQAASRVIQILMAWRRLQGIPLDRGIPKSMLRKSYLPETLQFLQILERSEGRPTEGIDRILERIGPHAHGRNPDERGNGERPAHARHRRRRRFRPRRAPRA